MEVLELNKKQLIVVNLLSPDDNDGKIKKYLKNFGIFSFTCLLFYSGQISSAVYIYNNMGNLSGVTNSLISNTGALAAYGAYLGFIANTRNRKKLQQELQTIVDQGTKHMLSG